MGTRVAITDYSELIILTVYRDGEDPVRVEQSPLQSLMIAERLLDAALRRLIKDEEMRLKFM